MIAPLRVEVHPFYRTNLCRLHICPGRNKRPVEKGYPDTFLTWEQIQPRLDAGEATRYCWLHDHEHLILDVDVHDPLKNGWETLKRLSQEIGVDLFHTCRARLWTPTNGVHLCFSKPAELRIRTLIGIKDKSGNSTFPGIDVLSRSIRSNSLTIGAGSTHPDVQGAYLWDEATANPQLIGAPVELLQFLEIPAATVPEGRVGGQQNYGLPGDDFMKSWTGVEILAAVMSERGYQFRMTSDEEGSFYEFVRPAKTTGSERSGHLGKVSREGNHQLTSFSHSDELFPCNQSITILEAICRVMHQGKGTDDPEAAKHTIQFLVTKGFGRSAPEIAFAGIGTAAANTSSAAPADEGVEELPIRPEHRFTNYRVVAESDTSKATVPLSLGECIAPIKKAMISVAGQLLVPQAGGGMTTLSKPADLFAWIQTQRMVAWNEGPNMVSKAEFYSGLLNAVPRYESIAVTPHYPRIPGVFYSEDIPPGDAQDLYDFVDHFAPATPWDRLLLIAAIVTPFWGGPPASRPVFLITSANDNGVGSGKSTLVQTIARLINLGGHASLAVRSKEDFQNLERKLANQSPTNPDPPRILVIDNYTGAAIGGQLLEGFVTEPRLDLHKLYVGTVGVPNHFTWYLTSNAIEATEDFAQRSVEVRLAKPAAYSAEWVDRLENWDLRKVVAGIGAFLTLVPRADVREVTRFPNWCREVLARLSDSPETVEMLVEMIRGRSDEASVASSDAAYMSDLLQFYHDMHQQQPELWRGSAMYIKTSSMCETLNFHNKKTQMGKPWSSNFLGRMLTASLGRVEGLVRHRTKHERGFLWSPPTGGSEIVEKVENRRFS